MSFRHEAASGFILDLVPPAHKLGGGRTERDGLGVGATWRGSDLHRLFSAMMERAWHGAEAMRVALTGCLQSVARGCWRRRFRAVACSPGRGCGIGRAKRRYARRPTCAGWYRRPWGTAPAYRAAAPCGEVDASAGSDGLLLGVAGVRRSDSLRAAFADTRLHHCLRRGLSPRSRGAGCAVACAKPAPRLRRAVTSLNMPGSAVAAWLGRNGARARRRVTPSSSAGSRRAWPGRPGCSSRAGPC